MGDSTSRKYIPLLGDVFLNWVTIRDPQSTTRFVTTPELDLPPDGHYAILRVQWSCKTIKELEEGNLLVVDRSPDKNDIHANDLIVLPISPQLERYKMVKDARYYITRHTPSRPLGNEWKVIRVIEKQESTIAHGLQPVDEGEKPASHEGK
jgi:hypothetical protein